MNTKLTLTIEDHVIKKAKSYAKSKGRSLSDIIENFLRVVTDDQKPPVAEQPVSSVLKGLKGSFSAAPDFDYKKEMLKALTKKYL
ncbi:MAG TPA: DUF6364 family protein [Agriterribacter sp.]|nr:hypothetical protein [Chitinophagaceae bacterium]HRP32958.1 DUF6364 family protein [Agriterribacter sp.]